MLDVRVCRGLGLVFAFASLVSGCPGAVPEARDASTGDVGVPCRSNTDCDDGRFCNGAEQCMPDGACMPGALPCGLEEMCIDVEGRCVGICALHPDSDGDGVPAARCGGIDCDDADANAFPGNPEVCDDLGHDEDCNPMTFGLRDRDGDGDVDSACCNTDRATMNRICGGDCGDERRDIRSGLAESCDGQDNDCDSTVDEGVTRMLAPDTDLDLHGSSTAMALARCIGDPGFSTVADDCDDDMSPDVFGAQLEICDGIDNNCNVDVDEVMGRATWYPDADGDGFGGNDATAVVVSCAPVPGHVTRPGDCDDTLSDIHPGATERCNGLDDDCNGRADYRVASGNTEDDDGDGAADMRCGGGDCDDASAAIGPSAPELMDGLDNDCNGAVDDSPGSVSWWIDRDGDGYGDTASTPTSSLTPVAGHVTRAGDCDDGDVFIHPGAADRCDGIDDDCDGVADEAAPLLAFFTDGDGDGWADDAPASIVLRCRAPAAAASRVGDCDDRDATRHPTAIELCNAIDEDCDTIVDETPASLWYVDADGDGVGSGAGAESCMPIVDRVPIGGDCDDADARRFPGQVESCNGVDDDCDTMVDDGASASCTAPHTMTPVCTAGACALSCAAGFTDCDRDESTGCETDTAHSPRSCGACFRPCGVADSCGRTAASGTCDVSPISRIWAGDAMFFASRATGGIAAWGQGLGARLSIPFPTDEPAPILADIASVSAIAPFGGGACALRASGAVACWGTINGVPATMPTRVPLPGAAIAIGASSTHGCAVLADRTIQCWGDDTWGALSNGPGGGSPVPGAAMDAGGPITDAIGVACGVYDTCILRERSATDRYVSCAGWNREGGLGDGTTIDTARQLATDVIALPVDLVALSRGGPYGNTCVRDVAGRAYCWGYNASGMLGLGPLAAGVQPIPTTPPGLESGVLDIVFAAAGAFGGCAIRAAAGGAREALCWGSNPGAGGVEWLGDGVTGPASIFVPTLLGPAGSPIRDAVSIARGHSTACVLRATGQIWCAGDDTFGQLGDGPTDSAGPTLVRVTGLP